MYFVINTSYKKNMKKSIGLNIFYFSNYVFITIVSMITLIPFLLVFMSSISDETSIQRNGYLLIPEKFSLQAYKVILGTGSTVYGAYKISIIVTIVGTVLAVIITSMMAYAGSRSSFKYRNIISLIAYWPMVFYTGIVPFYIVLIKLGFKNSIWGLILPMVCNPFNVFLMINYFRSLPSALIDSAKIDGASEFATFSKVIMPLSGPVVATVMLFYLLAYWNNWYLALLLIEKQSLYPLQYLLRQIMSKVLFAQSGHGQLTFIGSLPAESIKMATVIVTIGPIIFVYPYIQKYFVKGITIGAVKG